MNSARHVSTLLFCLAAAIPIHAQAPAAAPPPPPPLWDTQVGAAFVGTSGNSDTTTIGGDFSLHRRWPVWKIEATATAVRTTDRGTRTAERYLGSFRGDRKLSSLLGVTAGERAERDRLAGMAFRSITDAGLSWALVRDAGWTLDGLTAVALNHEHPTVGPDKNHPIGVLQALSKVMLGPAADTTQRFTFYPDFEASDAYRAEAEVTAQAAMNGRIALKVGYLWRRSNAPTPGFMKNDSTATASVVVRWKAATAAPAP
jgi:putative salt-induced outer membrane protein YdiY